VKTKRSSVIRFLIICLLFIIVFSITVISIQPKCGTIQPPLALPGSGTCDDYCVYTTPNQIMYNQCSCETEIGCWCQEVSRVACTDPTPVCMECENTISYNDPVTIACCKDPLDTTLCLGCDSGGPPPCDKDGTCDSGESPASCPFDCTNCTAIDSSGKYTRNTQAACEGPMSDASDPKIGRARV
jgi:hypothetical protein